MDGSERDVVTAALAEDDVVGMVRRLGFEVEGTPVKGAALRAWGLSPERVDDIGELTILSAAPGMRLLHIDGGGCWKAVRRAMMAVHRASPETTVLWWWSTPRQWTAAMVEADRRGARRVQKLVLDRKYPDEVGMMQWLAFSPSRRIDDEQEVDASAWRRHFSEVLDQDGVTRDFFRGFSQGLDELVETMRCGPDDDELRHEIALGTLLRVVFLYFLQARGALDGDRRFIMRRFRDKNRSVSFYRTVLRPLFFGALNCPPDRRTPAACELGDLPFLNGGLFEPTAAERAHPDLDWDDQVWRKLLEGLFERHRFAVEWSHRSDLCRAVDPEMLGKVFEGLMYGDRRRTSASFYTPRDAVRSIVEQTLAAWLAEKASLEEDAAASVIDGHVGDLSAEQRRRAREALAELAVLDPAVGTGAFLLELLRVLRRVDAALDDAEGVVRTPGERYDRMRNLVHDHLFGVDIQPTAVRLCELRIWLAMLAALPELPAEKMPPLPNLSHRLCTGNSLLEPLDWVRFRVAGESACFGHQSARFQRRNVERLAVLQRAYTRAHGDEKVELKRTLDDAQKKVEHQLIESRKNRLSQKLKSLEALRESADLFGEKTELKPARRREWKRLRREMEALEKAGEDLEADRRRDASFCVDAHFAPVMARGGFDIVVTNPPWVRTRRIDGATRNLYRARYDASDHRLWPDASSHGIRAHFGAQIDMAALFVERSLELLRPGGRLGALVPVKLFRSLHGAGLRGVLADHRVEYIEDRSEDDEAMFDATTYPAILRVRKQKDPVDDPPPVDVSVWRRGGPKRFRTPLQNLCVHGTDMREPWMLVEPQIEEIFRTMQDASVPLGSAEPMPIRGGVKTGCNAAFVMKEEQARRTFSPVIRAQYLRWAVRGRDVTGATPERQRKIIWPVDDEGEIAETLPAELEDYFEAHRERLLGRSDYRTGPMWTLFRRHDDIENPGVAWRDLGEQLEATFVDADSIPLNTVYYLPAPSEKAAKAVMTLFHSEPMRAMAFAVGERARGGWRRHFAWVMKMLPVPRTWLAAWTDGDGKTKFDDEAIHRAYGLSGRDVERLAAWRAGTAQRQNKEAA